MPRTHRAILVTCTCWISIGTVGCEGSLANLDEFRARLDGGLADGAAFPAGDGDGDGDACGDIPNDLLRTTCVAAGCHQAAESAGGLDLESPDIAGRLADQPASIACDGEVWIDTSAPEQSLIYRKLLTNPPCGLRMPLGDALGGEEIACVLSWLQRSGGQGGAGTGGAGTGGAGTGAADSGMGTGGDMDAGMSGMDAGGEPTDAGQSNAGDDAGEDLGGTALARDGWTATASVANANNPPPNAIDGDPDTRFTTGVAQAPGQWFQIDFGSPQTFSEVVLDTTGSDGDYARGYEFYATDDPNNWGDILVEGAGSGPVIDVMFPEQTARYLIIQQTGSDDTLWWSIYELTVYR